MPTIPDYEANLRARRTQLSQARTQVETSVFQKPIVQQRVLRQLTPGTSLKLKQTIGKMKKAFEVSKASALGEIESGFAEQDQLEKSFLENKPAYEDYILATRRYERQRERYERNRAEARERSAISTSPAPSSSVTVTEVPAQVLPGVIVRDYSGGQAPSYRDPTTGRGFSSFLDLQRGFSAPARMDPTLNLAPVNAFVLKDFGFSKPIMAKNIFGLRGQNFRNSFSQVDKISRSSPSININLIPRQTKLPQGVFRKPNSKNKIRWF
ncbi:MAG: hypothetical protein ACHQ1D_00930 [Nitrososphaerales archaeon]